MIDMRLRICEDKEIRCQIHIIDFNQEVDAISGAERMSQNVLEFRVTLKW